MCLHFLFKSVFHKLRHKFLSGFVNSFPDYVVPFTHTFADHSSVITKCWGFELQNGKSSLKSPQTLAAQGFAPASFSSMNDKMNTIRVSKFFIETRMVSYSESPAVQGFLLFLCIAYVYRETSKMRRCFYMPALLYEHGFLI